MAKGKHKNKKQQKQNTQSAQAQSQAPIQPHPAKVSIQPQSSKPIDQRQRQIKKICDESFAMYAQDIRDTFITKNNGIASALMSHPSEHPLSDLIDRSMDFMDYDNIRINYRKYKTVQVAGKLKEYLAELYDELSSIMDVEREWVRVNSLPNPTYDGMDNSAYVHTGAVIWILDQIKKTRKAGKLVDLLPDRRYIEDVFTEMPDIWDPCFDLDVIEGVEYIVQRRNDDCIVGKNAIRFGDWYNAMYEAQETEAEYKLAQTHKRLMDEGLMDLARLPAVEAKLAEKHTPYLEIARNAKPYPYRDMGVRNRFLLDEPTAEGIQCQDVPSRQRFESLLSLIPQEVIDGAVERCEARIWDLVKRYYRCMLVFAKRELELQKKLKALEEEGERQVQALTGFTMKEINAAQKNGGLPYLVRKKFGKTGSSIAPVMSPLMNSPVMNPDFNGFDPVNPMGLLGVNNATPMQNVMPMQDEAQRIMAQLHKISGKILAEQEELEDRLYEYENERNRFNMIFGVMKGNDSNRYFGEYGDEILQIMSDLPAGDPYETCFAFLYMIDRGHDLMGCYFASSTVLGPVTHLLPWTNGMYRLEDDIVWGWHEVDDKFGAFDEADEQDAGNTRETVSPQRKKKSSDPEMPDWYDLKYQLSDYQEDRTYNLAQIFYKQTGVILPRDMDQYYPVLSELARYGITGKKMTLPLLLGMTIAGNARNQMEDWKNMGLFSEFDRDDVHTADESTEDQEEPAEDLAEDKDTQITELKEKLDAAKKEVERLNRALHAADVKVRESKKQIEAQSKQNESQRQELADLRDLLFNYGQGEVDSQRDADNQSDAQSAQVKFPYETRHRTLVFGGHDSFLREIKPRLPSVRFLDKNAVPDLGLIRNAEVIWVQTNCISHTQYNRMLDAARTHNVPVRYFSFASAEKCAVQLAEADTEMQ